MHFCTTFRLRPLYAVFCFPDNVQFILRIPFRTCFFYFAILQKSVKIPIQIKMKWLKFWFSAINVGIGEFASKKLNARLFITPSLILGKVQWFSNDKVPFLCKKETFENLKSWVCSTCGISPVYHVSKWISVTKKHSGSFRQQSS